MPGLTVSQYASAAYIEMGSHVNHCSVMPRLMLLIFLEETALSERHISIRILVNLVLFVPVGYFYSYVISDGVCKYYESPKESK